MRQKANLLMKIFLYAVSLSFTCLWTLFLLRIFQSELDFSLLTKLLCLIIGVLLHLGFVLATFQLKRSFQWGVAILLIPTILFNFGFMRMALDSLGIAILWGILIGFVSYYQVLKKGEISYEKSN